MTPYKFFFKLHVLRTVFLFFSVCVCNHVFATHQKAAEITYKNISGYTYEVKITTFTYTESLADRPELVLKWGDNSYSTLKRSKEIIHQGDFTKENHYFGTHTYSGPGKFYLSMEDNDRNGGVINIPNSINTSIFVDAIIVISPFIDPPNSSPVLLNLPIDKGCLGQVYMHNPGAYDVDGDSLSYKLVNCRGAGGEVIPGYYMPHTSNFLSINEKTGDLTWDSPIEQGEFNVAIMIEEWRSGVKIGEMTRDMQITIQACNNRPPHLMVDEQVCIQAGKTITIPVDAIDADSNYIRLYATGGIFDNGMINNGNDLPLTQDGKAKFTYLPAKDSVHGELTWNTLYKHAQLNPFPVYFKAQDNGNPPLVDLKTLMIKVIAPASQFVKVDPTAIHIGLSWNKNPTPKIYGYNLYRSQGYYNNDSIPICQTGVVDTSFIKIAEFFSPSDTVYVDTSSDLRQGVQYIYQLEGLLTDGAKTYPSQKIATKLINTAPLITKVNVLRTSEQGGKVELNWQSPNANVFFSGDTLEYEIWRGKNLKEQFPIDTLLVVDSLNLLYSYMDESINTKDISFYYRIFINQIENGKRYAIAYSYAASTVYLQTFSKNKAAYLSWEYDHPWMNHTFVVFRSMNENGPFDSITTVKNLNYLDKNLENGQTYFYYVRAYGDYYSSDVPYPLVNNSNISEVIPASTPPCPAVVKATLVRCEPLETLVEWNFENDDCDTEIKEYELYYKNYKEEEFQLLEVTPSTSFNHIDPDSYFGCYAVKAINFENLESELSATVCTDHRSCFQYKLPNVFTPNGDGYNDYFKALPNQYVQKIAIHIYDRWGSLVFSSTDPQFKWDGKNKNGKLCENGAYFYVVEFKSGHQSVDFELTQTGSIVILRE